MCSKADIGPSASAFFMEIEETIPFIEEDRPLDALLGELCHRTETGMWSLDWQEGAA